MTKHDARLNLTLTKQEKQTLNQISQLRRTSEAATVRWLIWREARRRELRRERGQLCTA